MTKLLTPAKAASLLGLNPETLRAWRRFGRGPTWTRLGKRYRYTHESLEAILANGANEGGSL